METVRVVVADDNLQLRDMVTEYLQEQSGIEVVGAAANGVEALQLVQEREPDVLICDMIMPQMDGYAVLERLQAMKPGQTAGRYCVDRRWDGMILSPARSTWA